MPNPITFTHPTLGTLRTVLIDEKPWFILTDVCRILHYRNCSQVTSRLNYNEHSKCTLVCSRIVNIVNEVSREILPSISISAPLRSLPDVWQKGWKKFEGF